MFGQGRPASLELPQSRQDATNAALEIMTFFSPLKTPSLDFHNIADYCKWFTGPFPARTPTSLPTDQQQHAQQDGQQPEVVATGQVATGAESGQFEAPRQPVLSTLGQSQDVQPPQQHLQPELQQPLKQHQHYQQYQQMNQQELQPPHYVQYQLQQQQLQTAVQYQVIPPLQVEDQVKHEPVEASRRNDYDNTKVKLTDEEKLRNKRERNRKAAANCRKRKDEKLKRLEDENMALRMRIESLEATIVSLERVRHN